MNDSGACETRKGACHCGAIRFTVDLPRNLRVSRCNCTLCSMKGAVMAYAPLAALTLQSGEDSLACYRFNTGEAKHYFCRTCGIHCYHQTRSHPDLYAINVACLEGVDIYAFEDIPVANGRQHPKDTGGELSIAGSLRFVKGSGPVDL